MPATPALSNTPNLSAAPHNAGRSPRQKAAAHKSWVFKACAQAVSLALASLAPPAGAVDFTWMGGTGNWSPNSGSNWDQAVGLPGAADNVLIDNGSGTTSVVSLNVGAIINNLSITSGDSLGVNNSQSLTILGSVSNSGALGLNSAGNLTNLYIGPTTTFVGDGTLTLSNSDQNRVMGNSGATTEVLTNTATHTIRGAGQLGVNSMGLNNQGLIEANGSAGLLIDVSATGMTNSGTLRAAGGTLTMTGTSLANTGGVIDAAGSNVAITGSSTITGGTLQSSAGGKVLLQNGSNLANVSNTGQAEIANNQNGLLTGTFTNTGNLQLASTGNTTDLRLNGDVTLTGTGSVTMSNYANNRIFGSSGSATEVLTNATDHTIQGAGQLGVNNMGLNNQGLIEANGSAGLLIDVSATGMTNSGTLRAGTGVLTIQGSTVTSTPSGVLDAAGSNIVINGSTINGTMQGSGTNKIFVQGASNLVDVTNSTQLEIANNQNGLLTGTFTNTGNLQLASTGNTTDLRLNGDVTLTGAGSVTMSNYANNRIFGNSGSATEVLTNATDHTIQGAGQLGVNNMGLNNQGLIEANGSAGLVIDVSATGMTNSGTLRAGTGVLTIQSSTVTSTPSGVLDAAGSNIVITGSTINGTMQGSGTNKIFVQGASNLVDVTNSTQLEIANNQNGLLTGTFTNTGNLQLASTGNTTDLRLNGDVTLTGAGSVTMSNYANNRTFGNSGSATEVLTNATDHTIRGAGQLGVNSMGLNNQGLILANESAGMTIDLSNVAGVTRANTGTLRAAGGTLTITGSSLANTGGVIDAAGSNVAITGSSTITGGTLQSSAGGKVLLQGSSNLVNVSNTGQTEIANADTGFLSGTFTNTGNLQLASTANTTDLRLNGDVTLTGAGSVTMSNYANNRIFGNSGSATEVLTNAAGHTIQGAGQLGVNQMGLNNQGLILANESAGLTINTSAAGGLTNNGTMRASGGTLTINDALTGTGTIQIDPASVMTLANLANTQGQLVMGAAGSTLNIGTQNLTINSDYTNVAAGGGNSFNRRAGVTGAGQIIAGGDAAQAITGTGVTDGNTANATLTIGNVRVGVTTVDYQMANTGTTGPALRGAIQTTANGANLTDSRLSGAGVTAGNYNTGAPGNDSGNLGVTFTAASAGALAPLTGQVLNLTSNFDNIANQKLNIVLGANAAAYNIAVGNATPTPVNFGNRHVGDVVNQALTVQNTAAADGFSEKLNASFGATTGAATNNNGIISQLAAGGSNASAMSVSMDTSSAGAKSGSATLNYVSDGTGTSGLANIAVGDQVIDVTGSVYRLASANNLGAITFGNVHVGDTVQQALSITNTAVNDAYSEKLNASFGASSDGRIITSGGINLLAAGSTDNGSMVVGLNTSAAGSVNGTQVINFASDGVGTSGLGITALASQTIGVSGDITTSGSVFRLAGASPATPNPVDFGNVRVGTLAGQALSISNTAASDGFSEKLNASISSNGAPVTASGSFNLLGPQATDSTSLHVSIDTSSAGAKSGSATIALVSDGTGTSDLGQTNLASQTVDVSGKVYRLADPTLNTSSASLAARVGDTAPQAAISVSNTSPDEYTEGLKASIGATPAGFSTSGNIANLAANDTDASTLQVALNTGAAGTFGGNAQVDFASTGAGTTGEADISVGSQMVNLVGKVYQKASALVQSAVDFGIVHVGDMVATRNVQVDNTATTAALNDTLIGGIGGAGGPFSATGSLAGIVQGGSDSSSLNVGLNTSTAGVFSSNATVNLASHNADMADLFLADASVMLNAQVNNYANADLNKTGGDGGFSQSGKVFTLDFGNVILGASANSWLEVLNDVVGPADLLDGLFNFLDAQDFLYAGFGGFSDLAAGNSVGGLNVGFDSGGRALGMYGDDILLASLGHNMSGYSGALDNITLRIRANVVQGGGTVPEPGTLYLAALALLSMRLMQVRRRRMN